MEINEELIQNLCVNEELLQKKITEDTDIRLPQVKATVSLLREGNTIPFISRYRKEVTGSLDEVQVREISHRLEYRENLENRKIEVIHAIFKQGKLDENLMRNIHKCETMTELESLYAPYKKKKKTRAMIAIEKGLSELANLMETMSAADIEKKADDFVDAEKGVADWMEALQGAMDIVAERVSQNMDNRGKIKDFLWKTANIEIKGDGDAESSVYKMYYDFNGKVSLLKPHHILAINRGEKEGELKSKIDFDFEESLKLLESGYQIKNAYFKGALEDGLKRLLLPSLEREIRSELHEKADKQGISLFSKNLQALLMSPPLKGTRVMGIDPGIRTGTKIAMMDETGKFLDYFMIYQRKADEAKAKIAEYVKRYNTELIAIGNGTGSHDVQVIVAETIAENKLDVQYTVVSEDGASVYSASDVAREEFPKLDLTIRGAISIGRRLQDPLAELVKIDPQSIGVGLYQHDLNQKELSHSLDEVVESVVNRVGVNINTASYSLLKYVSGVSLNMAKNIVEFRNQAGKIQSRDVLKKISGMGPKTFEQAAGFLKIPDSENPLDATWVHPENYHIAKDILAFLKSGNKADKKIKQTWSEKYGVGMTTIEDIVDELQKPGRDPREGYPKPILQKGVVEFSDLKVGMKVTGKVKNVVDFGAFVDIGIKETALVHISEISDNFVSHPMDVLTVGDVKEFSIIDIDERRKRIGLSLKTNGARTVMAKKKTTVYKKSLKKEQAVKNYKAETPVAGYNPFRELLKK